MSSEKDTSDPGGIGLKQRWDRRDQRLKDHEAEGRWIEDESWAIAKALYEAWNPHNEPVKPRHTPRDGKTMQALGDELGRSRDTVSHWIAAHRRFGHAVRDRHLTFQAAVTTVAFGTQETKRSRTSRSEARKTLRERPQEVAAEIAKALEKREVAKAVKAALSEKAKQELVEDVLERVKADPEPEPEEPATVTVDQMVEAMKDPEVDRAVYEARLKEIEEAAAEERRQALEARGISEKAAQEEERQRKEEREERRRKRPTRGMFGRLFLKGLNSYCELKEWWPPEIEDEEAGAAFREYVLDVLVSIRVECDLAVRKLDGEQITEADREAAVAAARADKVLEGVDIEAEVQSFLAGER